MPSLPAGPVCLRSAFPVPRLLPAPPSQHGRICRRLIRRRQRSQGRTSECSDASAAVVELNFLISSIPLRRLESGRLRRSLSPCPPSFHLIKLPSIAALWGSSYRRSNHVYFLFEHLFRCSIAWENYSLYPYSWIGQPLPPALPLTQYFINQHLRCDFFCDKKNFLVMIKPPDDCLRGLSDCTSTY